MKIIFLLAFTLNCISFLAFAGKGTDGGDIYRRRIIQAHDISIELLKKVIEQGSEVVTNKQARALKWELENSTIIFSNERLYVKDEKKNLVQVSFATGKFSESPIEINILKNREDKIKLKETIELLIHEAGHHVSKNGDKLQQYSNSKDSISMSMVFSNSSLYKNDIGFRLVEEDDLGRKFINRYITRLSLSPENLPQSYKDNYFYKDFPVELVQSIEPLGILNNYKKGFWVDGKIKLKKDIVLNLSNKQGIKYFDNIKYYNQAPFLDINFYKNLKRESPPVLCKWNSFDYLYTRKNNLLHRHKIEKGTVLELLSVQTVDKNSIAFSVVNPIRKGNLSVDIGEQKILIQFKNNDILNSLECTYYNKIGMTTNFRKSAKQLSKKEAISKIFNSLDSIIDSNSSK